MAQATHTHKWPTHQPQCNTLWCMPWCPSTMPLTHTPKEEDHGLMAKVASTTCHHDKRERERLDGGQWTCERGQATCNTTGQKEAPLKPCSHHSSLHQQPPHHHTHHTSVVMVTHCLLTHSHTRAKAGQGAHHHQANGVDGLHSDHGVAQAWLWCGVAIKPCATRGGTHAIQVATCSPHCPTTTTTPVLSGVNTRATTSPHPSPRVCVTVALSHPPCPQVWSSTTVRPASPPPGPSSTTNHQQQQQHKSKRVW